MKTLTQVILFLIMLCPICHKDKIKSVVKYEYTYTKLANCEGYWDEEGVFHQPKCEESNIHFYKCSNFHTFSKTSVDLENMTRAEEAVKNKEIKK